MPIDRDAGVTSNLTADSSNKVQTSKKKDVGNGKSKLKSSKVKDIISKGRTMTGSKPDEININPVQEAAEKTAVMAFGRFNPITIGHEKLIKKVESTAKAANGKAHIIASHSSGDARNPLKSDQKVEYLKKVAHKDTNVVASTPNAPSILHHAAKLHQAGYKHLVVVGGSDRVNQYHEILNKYNGIQSKHGHYDFKSIKVVSAGDRDPDAEGAEGMSGTKMRELARQGKKAAFKKGLPKALHPHADEIINHIRSVTEQVLYAEEFKAVSEEIAILSSAALNNIMEKAIKFELELDDLLEQYNTAYASYSIAPGNLTPEQYAFNAVNSYVANFMFEKRGLWANIHAKRERIKKGSGEKMRKPGSEGAPTKADLIRSQVKETYNTPIANKDFGKTGHFDAIDNLELNTANRNQTVKEYSYGPLNPNEDNNEFWSNKAELWNTTIEEAKKSKCCNCAAFNQSEQVLSKIHKALGPDGDKIAGLANLGFCELFEFKCAGDRTCDAWLVGGPLKEEKMSEDIDNLFEKEFKASDREAVVRDTPSGLKTFKVVKREGDRKKDSGMYRQQAMQKQRVDEGTTTADMPEYQGKMAGERKDKKAPEPRMAKRARKMNFVYKPVVNEQDEQEYDYEGDMAMSDLRSIIHNAQRIHDLLEPNTNLPEWCQSKITLAEDYISTVANYMTANKEDVKEEAGCPLDEDMEIEELIEEDFIVSGLELYEDWGELDEEAEKGGRKVKLGKPFLTPGGPKKRAVYVKNDKGNVVKVNFGDPNMTIKKSDPARRRSFRARHNCDNPGPRHKARYWSCKAW